MKKIIIANWKCNPTALKEAEKIFKAVKKSSKNIRKREIVIAPPFVFLPVFKNSASHLCLAGQNCFYQEKGAFTGEISAKMLKDSGVKYIILGHSERRRIFGETDEMIAEKIKAVLRENLLPVFCLGETKKERKDKQTFRVLEKQIKIGLKKVPLKKINKLIVAYEPIWAIGTGKPCSVEEALRIILFIRKVIARVFNQKAARNIRVLYGGSINSKNSSNYLKKIDGLLVGGASLNPEEFLKILKN